MDLHFPGRMAGALAVAALLVAGCGGASGGSGGSGGPGGSQSTTGGSSGGSNSSSTASTTAGSTLFPVSVGEKWVYADHLGGLGTSTTTNTIKAIKPASGGNLVTLTDSSNILGQSKHSQLTYMFYANGSIGVPFTQINGGQVTIRSGSIVWPPASVIASGQAHTSVLAITLKTNGQTINEKVHVTVKGGGTHSVTVPAGTYQATVVDQTMAEKVLGHLVSIVIRTWLAPGVGPVQSEVLEKSAFGAGPQVREELKSFTK
jgi:uncharacterized protein DUF3108